MGIYGGVSLFNFHPLLGNTEEFQDHFFALKIIVISQSQFLLNNVIIKQGNLKLPLK